jgi:hypothetical protein
MAEEWLIGFRAGQSGPFSSVAIVALLSWDLDQSGSNFR